MSQFPIPPSREIRLAMLGMVDGNGHPYSWSAIVNGYDPAAMAHCPYPVIPEYLAKQPPETFGISDVTVTHIWTDDPADAQDVARACHIPKVVENAGDVIGQVDAVVIATDRGEEHVERCRPFVEAGIPVFVDKPMVDSEEDLRTVCDWVGAGKPILSSSSMRYAKELLPYRISTADLGELRWLTLSMMKSWERYGIHALEAVYPITGPGYVSCRNSGTPERNIIHLKHERGFDVTLGVMDGMSTCTLQIVGTGGSASATIHDTFYGFKTQLEEFVGYLRTGVRPYAFSETIELMKLVIAGIRSRENDGAEIFLRDILPA